MSTKRMWILAAAVVAVVAVGVGWGLAGGGSGGSGSNGPPSSAANALGTDGDRAGSDGAANLGSPAASDPGSTSGSTSDSTSESGAGSGSGGGGGTPDNQPPVIGDPGLSSEGLLLRIDPTVTDPDGDDVSLLFEIDGRQADPMTTCFGHPTCKGEEEPSATPTKASAVFDHTEVGYQHVATVTVIATDSRGATSRETFTHKLAAISTVIFRDFRFSLTSLEDCFREESSRSLSYQLDLSGAIAREWDSSGIPVDQRTRHYFLVRTNAADFAGQPPALLVNFSASLEGVGSIGFAAPRQYSQSEDVVVPFYTSHDCRGEFRYRVQFIVR